MTEKRINLFNGTIEVLQSLINKEITSFSTIKMLKNHKTSKIFSANTIALRLRELENYKLIERKMFKNENRWGVGYIITDKGIKLIKVYDQFNVELKKMILDE